MRKRGLSTMETYNKKQSKKAYRLPPCPAHDMEGMEKWLCDLGEEGLFLEEDGFFAGVATFEKGEPRKVKYRLEAAQKSTSMWADDGGEPDGEQVEFGKNFAWEYVAKRGDFYIYRSFDFAARELNTDPRVQAIALNAAKKRLRESAISSGIWLIFYPLLLIRSGILLTVINMRTWLFLLTALFVLWIILDEILAFTSVKKLQKKLRFEGRLQRDKDWRKGALAYHGKRVAKIALALALVCIFLGNWSDSVMNANKIPLAEYTGNIPFATMADFAGENPLDYRSTMTGLDKNFNCLHKWEDWLAPLCMDYSEHAAITLANGNVVQGGYNVDYCQAASPAIAKRLAKEMYKTESQHKLFLPMELPPSVDNCDEAYACYRLRNLPTVIIRKGCKVIRACFYQTSPEYTIPDEEWMAAVAQSLN